MTYTYDQTYQASLLYFNGNDLSAKVFCDKYALRNNQGELLELTPADMHRRIAKEIARVEKKKFGKDAWTEDYIFELLDKYKSIIPQGSPLYGIGNTENYVSLSNCFVLDEPHDSYADILRVDEQLIQVSKRRGGCGISLNRLRPKGTETSNSSRSSTGVVSWMERYSNSTREAGQCVKFDQRVLTKNGLKRISNVNIGDFIWTKEGWVKNLKTINNGKKELYKVTTTSGYTIETSIDHIFQTHKDGILTEEKLKNLEAGDSIVLCLGDSNYNSRYVDLINPNHKNSNNKPSNCILPSVLNEELSYLLGYSYGDGSIENERTLDLACSNDYSKIKEQLDTCCKNTFDYDIKYRKGDGDLERLSIHNKTIVKFLEHNNLLKQKSKDIIFPEKILQSPVEVQQAFISGYFDADGYASGPKKGYSFASISLKFLEEVQFLLSSYGIASKIHSEDRSKQGWNTLYNLCVVGCTSQEKLIDICTSSIKIKKSSFIAKRESWITPFKAKSFNIKQGNYSYCPDNSQNLSLSVVNKLKIDNQETNTNLIIDNIRSIEKTTEDYTYDLRLESEHLFWCEGYYIHNSGRRGALMLTLNVHHPDVLDFITAKSDPLKVTGANISTQYTDEFLNAVEKGLDYEQRWPLTIEEEESATHNKLKNISQYVSAKSIWDNTVEQAWQNAEPGVQFIDQVLRESPADCYEDFQTITSNPCQASWAKVLTKKGIREFGSLGIGTEIWSKEGWTKVVKKWSNGKKDIYKYTTTAGVFYGTKNHKLVVDNKNIKVEAKDADRINIITGSSVNNVIVNLQDIMDGLVIGDGSFHKASNNLVGLYIGQDDHDYFDSEIKSYIKKHRPGIKDTFYEVETTVKHEELVKLPKRPIPQRFLKGDSNRVCNFLRGLYSANGSVCGNRITLKSSSIVLIEQVQMMLSSIGIKSYYTTNKSKKVEFENGEYTCKESYDLNISTDRNKFIDSIGFLQGYKNTKIVRDNKQQKSKSNYEIISVEKISNEEVFDITVDNKSHTYWTQGCNVSNCGEIYLSALDSCRLLALNLFNFIINPFEETARFDYDKFFDYAKIAQRFIDNIIDLEIEAIDRIIKKVNSDPESKDTKSRELSLWKKVKEVCVSGRRTGVGITALGDTIAGLNIRYGSEECISTVEEIYKTLKFGCYTESVDLAEKFGAFSVWDHKKEKDNPFLNRIKDEEIILDRGTISGKKLYAKMKKFGRRHIALLTTAPTGSISTQACLIVNGKYYFGSSSGIEPVWQSSHIRRKKGNPGDDDFRVDFTDDKGDTWMEFKIFHQGVQAFMDLTGEPEEASPYLNGCAPDIDWINRVKLQGAAQRHVDHSISSTINLPNDVQKHVVNDIFLAAWKEGLKGITVYRDGCRTGVLINEEKGIPKTTAPKRPKELKCDVHRVVVKSHPYFILVGLLDGEPYETFAGKDSFISDKVKHGKIIKMGRPKCYKAVLDDGTEVSPLHAMADDNEEALMRMTSTALRHGANIEFVQTQLSKTKGELNNFAKAVARALKKYIKDGTESKEQCTECSGTLIFSEGCLKCQDCSYSKCS